LLCDERKLIDVGIAFQSMELMKMLPVLALRHKFFIYPLVYSRFEIGFRHGNTPARQISSPAFTPGRPEEPVTTFC
jgi:hypothetical protein